MKRYYPPNHDTGQTPTDGVRRIGIAEWGALWRDDPSRWRRAISDRPKRFDRSHWQRAIRIWRNEIPPGYDGAEGDRPLEGVPILAKDLYDVPGERTTCSSAVFLSGDGPEAPVASTAGPFVRQLIHAGAAIAGRTHMNEFAYGLDGRNRFTGDCPHPFASGRISGGSSSGSAWAVAAGIVPVALGTDTGGSIRLPAALCGVYGVRFGSSEERLKGVFPLAPSMDTVGLFTHSITDMQTMLATIVSPDISTDSNEYWRVGVLVPPGIQLNPEMGAIWEDVKRRLAAAEVVLTEEMAPNLLGDPAVDAYNVIGSTEAWSIHRELIERYGDLYDPVVRGLMERGKQWSEKRREDALSTRDQIQRYACKLFERYDAVVLPATVIPTPTYEEADGSFRSQILRLNTLGSLAGLPALSLPVHLDAVRSGGVQILFPRERENRMSQFLSMWQGIV